MLGRVAWIDPSLLWVFRSAACIALSSITLHFTEWTSETHYLEKVKSVTTWNPSTNPKFIGLLGSHFIYNSSFSFFSLTLTGYSQGVYSTVQASAYVLLGFQLLKLLVALCHQMVFRFFLPETKQKRSEFYSWLGSIFKRTMFPEIFLLAQKWKDFDPQE